MTEDVVVYSSDAVVESARRVVRRWRALGACEDEFGPEDDGACGEYRQALDEEILGLSLALAQSRESTP